MSKKNSAREVRTVLVGGVRPSFGRDGGKKFKTAVRRFNIKNRLSQSLRAVPLPLASPFPSADRLVCDPQLSAAPPERVYLSSQSLEIYPKNSARRHQIFRARLPSRIRQGSPPPPSTFRQRRRPSPMSAQSRISSLSFSYQSSLKIYFSSTIRARRSPSRQAQISFALERSSHFYFTRTPISFVFSDCRRARSASVMRRSIERQSVQRFDFEHRVGRASLTRRAEHQSEHQHCYQHRPHHRRAPPFVLHHYKSYFLH